jgi:hypothetical protein
VSGKAERQKRKAYLLSQIQQQRLDLSASRRDWIDATRRFDRGWNTFLSLRSWALVGSSVMAIWSVRHPNMLIRWARRGFGAWSAWRLVKATFVSSTAVIKQNSPGYRFCFAPSRERVSGTSAHAPYSISLKKIDSFPC